MKIFKEIYNAFARPFNLILFLFFLAIFIISIINSYSIDKIGLFNWSNGFNQNDCFNKDSIKIDMMSIIIINNIEGSAEFLIDLRVDTSDFDCSKKYARIDIPDLKIVKWKKENIIIEGDTMELILYMLKIIGKYEGEITDN